jgi:preprotein translocase subunit SecE
LIWVRILVPVQDSNMKKIEAYLKDSYEELMERVTWPTWEQLQQSTMIVLVATLVITALVWVMDFASNSILKSVYSLFK